MDFSSSFPSTEATELDDEEYEAVNDRGSGPELLTGELTVYCRILKR